MYYTSTHPYLSLLTVLFIYFFIVAGWERRRWFKSCCDQYWTLENIHISEAVESKFLLYTIWLWSQDSHLVEKNNVEPPSELWNIFSFSLIIWINLKSMNCFTWNLLTSTSLSHLSFISFIQIFCNHEIKFKTNLKLI